MSRSALVTPAEAAELLAVAERTLADWRYRGVGPAYISLSARCVRYRPRDLDAWLADRERTTTAGAAS